MKKILHFLTLLMLFLIACEADPDVQGEDQNILNDNFRGAWTVNASIIGEDFMYGPFTITTQSTSNKDSLIITDDNGFWVFQVKTAINVENKTFVSQSSVNTESTVGAKSKVDDGKVIGTDSISFNIQFEDDETPYGYTYNIKGRRQ